MATHSVFSPGKIMDSEAWQATVHGVAKSDIRLSDWAHKLKINISVRVLRSSLVPHTVKNLPAMQETQVQSLGWKEHLKKGMATHSSILAWSIPWTEEPGRLQCMGSQRVWQNWATKHTYKDTWTQTFVTQLKYSWIMTVHFDLCCTSVS